MGKVFLGKPLHWALLAIVALVIWVSGGAKMHVIHFNTFVLIMLGGSAALVLIVLWTSKPGEQVTRDPLRPEDGDSEAPLD